MPATMDTRFSEGLIGALTIALGLTVVLPTMGPLRPMLGSVGGGWLWASSALGCGAIELVAAFSNQRLLRLFGGLSAGFLWSAIFAIYLVNEILTIATIQAPILSGFAYFCALRNWRAGD